MDGRADVRDLKAYFLVAKHHEANLDMGRRAAVDIFVNDENQAFLDQQGNLEPLRLVRPGERAEVFHKVLGDANKTHVIIDVYRRGKERLIVFIHMFTFRNCPSSRYP